MRRAPSCSRTIRTAVHFSGAEADNQSRGALPHARLVYALSPDLPTGRSSFVVVSESSAVGSANRGTTRIEQRFISLRLLVRVAICVAREVEGAPLCGGCERFVPLLVSFGFDLVPLNGPGDELDANATGHAQA